MAVSELKRPLRNRLGIETVTNLQRLYVSGVDSSSAFTHIFITTPVVSALKNYYVYGYFKQLLDPGGGFASETDARRFQK